MDTLLLDTGTWDLITDAHNNIAMASNPYALAQNCASAIKLFLGELYYDTTQGVPYFQEVLGENPPDSLLRSFVQDACLTVPDVVSATCVLVSLTDRVLSGQAQVTDSSGTTTTVIF